MEQGNFTRSRLTHRLFLMIDAFSPISGMALACSADLSLARAK
jgi:hypothetical protein